MPSPDPIIVVGAGAAGLTAAIFAARAGASVLVVETRAIPGAKIRVSGGGRCNVLPTWVEVVRVQCFRIHFIFCARFSCLGRCKRCVTFSRASWVFL